MSKWILALGAAALAIASPVAAEKGGGHGGGKPAKVERGGGHGGGGKAAKAERGGHGGGGKAAKADRGGGREFRGAGKHVRAERSHGRDFRAERKAQREFGAKRDTIERKERQWPTRFAEDRGKRKDKSFDRRQYREKDLERRHPRDDQWDRRGSRDGAEQAAIERDGRRFVPLPADDERYAAWDRDGRRWRDWDDDGWRRRDWDDDERWQDWDDDRWVEGVRHGRGVGCPPGLAWRVPACVPPGQAKKLIGARFPDEWQDHRLPPYMRDHWWDDDEDHYYRWGDGYLYRVDRGRNLIASIAPLFGGGLGLGQIFPAAHRDYGVPSYYEPFYSDTPDDYYRYNDGYVYEIDRDSGLIEDIIPLYDRGYGIGQMLPASYNYYNLPYPYRDWYEDEEDYSYRYAPGAIYQVDPQSQLITGIASLLSGALGVGQTLPMGFDMYNVPDPYRATYYDTPDAWYRYSDGNIYQVDPKTRLIQAIVASLI